MGVGRWEGGVHGAEDIAADALAAAFDADQCFAYAHTERQSAAQSADG